MSTGNDLPQKLSNYTNGFSAVVPFDKEKGNLLRLDFTRENGTLSPAILADTQQFSEFVNRQLNTAGATYGIGGYGEHRTIYERSEVFDGEGSAEPRRLHLGVDIWGPVGVPVYAPLEGTVHSFAFNDAYGDYGATLILQHAIDGLTFHTLYGHLSLSSIEDKREGQSIEKGEWIANFGAPAENGHWPPHLHFQVIRDLQGWKGDYPGVCAYSEKDAYLANCPDGDLVLGMLQFAS